MTQTFAARAGERQAIVTSSVCVLEEEGDGARRGRHVVEEGILAVDAGDVLHRAAAPGSRSSSSTSIGMAVPG
jgi:hypothetical protein